MGITTSYFVTNDRDFAAAVNRAAKITDDLRVPLTLISKDWFQSQKAIFQLRGPGQYPPLKDPNAKKRRLGFDYPLLRGETRALERSVTRPRDPNAISRILNKKVLILGTQVEYGVFHQEGTKTIPVRKFVFIGPEAPRFARGRQVGRLQRWIGIMESFIDQKLEQQFGN